MTPINFLGKKISKHLSILILASAWARAQCVKIHFYVQKFKEVKNQAKKSIGILVQKTTIFSGKKSDYLNYGAKNWTKMSIFQFSKYNLCLKI